MTSNEALPRLRARLIARRNALRRALNDELERLRNESEARVVGDTVDAAVASANDEICSELVEIESRELGQIEHALERIARGTFGHCEFCGGKIPATRLCAVPYTSCCIDCQRKNEKARRSPVPVADTQPWSRVDENRFEEGDTNEQVDLSGCETSFGASRHWPLGHAAVSRSN